MVPENSFAGGDAEKSTLTHELHQYCIKASNILCFDDIWGQVFTLDNQHFLA
jgi:hypothetical protein